LTADARCKLFKASEASVLRLEAENTSDQQRLPLRKQEAERDKKGKKKRWKGEEANTVVMERSTK